MKIPRARSYRNPGQYRLDFIKENTFNRVWSIHMTRPKAILGLCVVVAAIAALITVIFLFTPVRRLLPGQMAGDLRTGYIDMTVRLDSLAETARVNDAYIRNIATVLAGDPTCNPDTVTTGEGPLPYPDSILRASEAEKEFARRYEQTERYNLSVLAPLAADGMVFGSPTGGTVSYSELATGGVMLQGPGSFALCAVYRGTVVACMSDAHGRYTLVIQHPNDFVTIYTGLGQVYVNRGSRVVAGQRIGAAIAGQGVEFEFCHNGTMLDPADYLPI